MGFIIYRIKLPYNPADWQNLVPQAQPALSYGAEMIASPWSPPSALKSNSNATGGFLLKENYEAYANTDIIAGHIYGGGLARLPLAEQAGKEIWMTEYLMNLGTGNTGAVAWTSYSDEEIWDETMEMALTIHDAMRFNWNAYIWWYTKRYYSFLGDGTQGTAEGEILKRGIAFSHYSKYIRPGYVRIEANEDQLTGLNITAYEGDDQIVVVIINPTETAVADVGFSVNGGATITSAGSYSTTLLLDRSFRNLEVNENEVVISVLGKSVTTVVLER